MAIASNFISKGLSGKIGKELVFKKYKDKTVVSKYPDMTNIAPSASQQQKRNKFAEAVVYAKKINDDPIQKGIYLKKIPKGKRVFNFALAEYLKK
jgi:hypothetical protein